MKYGKMPQQRKIHAILFGWYFTPDLIQCGASSESYDPTVRSSVGRCQDSKL